MEKIRFKIERKKGSGEWENYKINPVFKKPLKTKIIKMNNGVFATVSEKRTVYHLSWNGERFADGTDFKKFKKDFPKASIEVMAAIATRKV